MTAHPEVLVQLRNKLVADAGALPLTEGDPRASALARMRRAAGVLRPRPAGRETPQNWGGPRGSCEGEASQAGRRLMRPGRGNPATGLCRNLSSAMATSTGRWSSTGPGNAHRRLGGVVSRIVRRAWESPVPGAGRDKDAARTGHVRRPPADRTPASPPSGGGEPTRRMPTSGTGFGTSTAACTSHSCWTAGAT